MAPAAGTEFIAVGRVERSGKTLTVCRAELRSGEKVVAMMQGTMMAVRTEGMSD
jgi:acyl-coenzyme A thioesterase PaaI-like protein